jgi:hypothetical protein
MPVEFGVNGTVGNETNPDGYDACYTLYELLPVYERPDEWEGDCHGTPEQIGQAVAEILKHMTENDVKVMEYDNPPVYLNVVIKMRVK